MFDKLLKVKINTIIINHFNIKYKLHGMVWYGMVWSPGVVVDELNDVPHLHSIVISYLYTIPWQMYLLK